MKRSMMMAGFFASILALLGCGKGSPKEDGPADAYRGLRQQALTMDPAKIGISPSAERPVWGLLMETGYPGAVATLVTVGDGTVSLYFSNGGGIIGAGQHEGPRKACESLLKIAPSFLSHARPTKEFPLPEQGNTRFYFLTFDGVLTVEAKEDDLGNSESPLSPLFHKAHKVIAEVRTVSEK